MVLYWCPSTTNEEALVAHLQTAFGHVESNTAFTVVNQTSESGEVIRTTIHLEAEDGKWDIVLTKPPGRKVAVNVTRGPMPHLTWARVGREIVLGRGPSDFWTKVQLHPFANPSDPAGAAPRKPKRLTKKVGAARRKPKNRHPAPSWWGRRR